MPSWRVDIVALPQHFTFRVVLADEIQRGNLGKPTIPVELAREFG